MKVLVTGAGGFVGSWLVPALAERGRSVIGLDKPGSAHPDLPCEWLDTDLRDRAATRRAVARAAPDAIVHLAAIAVPREAAAQPLETLRMNFSAVDHLLAAVQQTAPRARVLVVSSGEVYARRAADAKPAHEDEPLAPNGPYAAAKAAAEQLARLAHAGGLDVMRARPFNHTGPRRPPAYAESSFARQLAEIERGRREPVVRVGNLSAVRDFSDVRDVVDGYALLLERGALGGVYNVCSGAARSMRSVLDTLCALCRFPVEVRVEAARFQSFAPETLASMGDPTRLRALGWRPRHRLEETLADLLGYWREQVSGP